MGLVIGLGGGNAGGGGGVVAAGLIQDMEGVKWTGTARISDTTITEFPGADYRYCTSLENMFYNCNSLISVGELKNTSKVTNMGCIFYNCSSLKDIPNFNTSNVTSFASAFKYSGVEVFPKLDYTKGNNFESTFYGTKIKQIDKIQFGSYVSYTRNMFYSCVYLSKIGEIIMTAISDTRSMFYNCNKLVSIGGIIYLAGCSSTYGHNAMFYNCVSLENVNINGLFLDLDLSYCKVLSIDSVLYLFNNAKSGVSGKTIQLNSLVFDQLTEEQIAIATEKGFSVTSVVRS